MTDAEVETVIDLGSGTRLERLVVPLTLDHQWDRGTSFAARLAERWDVPVRLVSVDTSGGGESTVDVEAGHRLEEACRAVRAAHPAITVDDEMLSAGGEPAAMLAGALRSGDLVVMATDHVGTGSRVASFAQALVHEWGGPVVMLGPNAHADVTLDGSVIVGLDGSAMAERALPIALGVAGAFDIHVWAVQVVPPAVTEHIERLRSRGERVSESAYIRDAIEGLGNPAINWEIVHAEHPAETLVSIADDRKASLLVLATHGESGLLRPTFGSVCAAVVDHARQPVVVVRPASTTGELALEP